LGGLFASSVTESPIVLAGKHEEKKHIGGKVIKIKIIKYWILMK
jgi:hypothetical protein